MKTSPFAVIALVAIALGGCAGPAPRVDAAFGNSVRAMVRSQTYDPHAAAHPPTLAPATGDGVRLDNALQAHRKDVATGSAQIAKPAQFDSSTQ